MQTRLLENFPPNTHSLTLVSDPDGLLAEEAVLSTLVQRGFQIVQEGDAILFRHRIEQLKPFDISNPVLVITDGELENLPYDLWQQGQHVRLALHEFFPNLAYPVIRTLTSIQLAQLGQTEQPKGRLGEMGTIQFLLEHVFQFNTNLIHQTAQFVLWLDAFHASLAPFPPALLEYVLELLQHSTNYRGWNLRELLQNRDTFRQFIQDQWQGFLSMQTGKNIGQKRGVYLLHFESEPGLQDSLSRLLRNGSLAPVLMETQTALPAWVIPGILMTEEDPRPLRMKELSAILIETLSTLTPEIRWEEWKTIAYQWAELTTLRDEFGIPTTEERDTYKEIQFRLDAIFTDWLKIRYSSLAAQKLPTPHHVYHIPHYINYLRSQGSVQRAALLVMDGMSLSDWFLLKDAWQSRQPEWQLKENLVLAQIPTITAISRHALISGLSPSAFYDTKLTEPKAWSAFWVGKELPENAINLIPLKLETDNPAPEITNPRLQALCLIERQLDEIMHGSMLGAMDHQSTVKLWLSPNSSGLNSTKLEGVINLLLEQRFTVFLASDHGHCEAYGMGQPSEGVIAKSRGRRARVYTDRRSAEHTQIAFNQTILWEDDGLLPKDMVSLIPSGRQAFTGMDEIVITHGGITIDEIVVPLVEINKK